MNPSSDPAGSRYATALGRVIVNHPWLVIAANVLVVALLGIGASRLVFRADYRVFFSPDNPQLKAFDELEQTYSKIDRTLIVLAPRNGDVFTAENLAAIQEVTRAAWKMPYATRVDSLTNFPHLRATGDDLAIDDLVPEGSSPSAEELQRIKKTALADPQVVDLLVSRRGHVAAVVTSIQLPGQHVDETRRMAAYCRKLAADFERAHPNFKVYLTGEVMYTNAFVEAGENDGRTLMPLMFLVLIVATYIVLRSVAATAASFIVVILTTAAAMGAAGWLGMPLTAMSAMAPSMVLTIVVCDTIHVLVSLLEHMRHGHTKQEGIIESLRENLRPEFLTAITTVVGFLTMNFADSPPLRDLGNICGIGITVAFALTMTFLPALLAVLPFQVQVKPDGEVPLAGFATFVLRYRRPILWGSVALVAVMTGCVFLNEVDDDLVKYFDKRFAIRTDAEFIAENLTGVHKLEFSIGAAGPGGVSDPAYLAKLAEFTDWYRSQPEVLFVASFSDVAKKVNRAMHGDDPAYYRTPDDRASAAQYLLLYEMALPQGQDLNDRLNVDKSATKMVVAVKNLKVREIEAVAARGEQWLKKNAPPYMASSATGAAVMFSHILERNIQGILSGAIAGVLIIGGVMAFTLKSIKYGVVALVMNAVPTIVAFGFWGIWQARMSFAIAVTSAMILGVVDDETVHWVSRYLDEFRKGASSEEAVRRAFGSVGKATIANALILTGGFSVMAFSGFRMNSDMSGLSALAIFIALVANVVCLPAVLVFLDGGRGKASIVSEKASSDVELSA